jgi:ferredoxin
MVEHMRTRAAELFVSGEVTQVLAWEEGAFPHYPTPAFFKALTDFDQIVFNRFCTANLSKYLIDVTQKTLVFLRPCDAHSFARLIAENQIKREQVYAIGVGCEGCVKVIEGEELGLLESCRTCTKTDYPIYDELIDAENNPRTASNDTERFAEIIRLKQSDDTERYGFWQKQLSRCIRCNACRSICPTCHCKVCILDNDHPLENQFFHITRAFHQNGRCTDCGQCARVCQQGIPLYLLNRKLLYDKQESAKVLAP